MRSKWIKTAILCCALPGLALAQTDIVVEDTGIVERAFSEGLVVSETHYVHNIRWTDTDAEGYDIFVSAAEITDIDADGVFKIAEGVPAGRQAYEYALQTPFAPGDVVNYYAVVASGSSQVTPGENATTEGTSGTAEFGQPLFWFVEEPFIDAEFSEWLFEPVPMSPGSPDNFFTGEWDGEEDFGCWTATGVDADNLYFRSESVDDIMYNVNETGSPAIWQGDVVEWYLGFYDLRPSQPRHAEYEIGNETDPDAANVDWQFDIAVNAFDDPARGHAYIAGQGLFPLSDAGLEVLTTVEGGDGEPVSTALEARLPLAGVVHDPALMSTWQPRIGNIVGSNFVCNDGDDPAGGRQGHLHWAQDESAIGSWNQPSTWGREQVIYDPRVFGLGDPSTSVKAKSWGEIKAGVAQ